MLVGHQKIWRFLKKSVEINQLPHALLFSGQEKLGKKTLALELIKLINQEEKLERSLDFLLIEPQDKEIQISQIRDLSWRLSLKPYSAPFKTAVLDQAHLMNQEAQSGLLKTLEEPKGKTLLVLVSEYPEMLLPTILSRLEQIKFYPVEEQEIRDYLKGRADIEDILKFSLGRPGMVIDFINNPQVLEFQRVKVRELKDMLQSDLASRFQYIKDLPKEPEGIREILDIWLGYFRELMLSEAKKGNYSLARLNNILKKLERTRFLISNTNINSKLALEALVLEL